MAIETCQEMYTEKIVTLGVVRRMYFCALFVLNNNGVRTKEWHYWGTTPATIPPTTSDPVFQHTYIQMPDDLLYAGAELNSILYDLGLMLGKNRDMAAKK